MSDTVTIARKLKSGGVEWEEAQIHAEAITAAVDDALGKVATKAFVVSQVAELRAENAELRGEMQTGFAELRGENAELRGEMQTGFAELRGEMQTGFAELRAENAEQRVEDKASQLNQLRWIVGTIAAIGSLIIATEFFA